MHKYNKGHTQLDLFYEFPQTMSEFLDEINDTKEYFFYENVFSKIDEKIFKSLYCKDNGRPNAPINVMVSALLLKEKRNWSYSEMFDEIRFNLAIRAALGLFSFYGMPFSESTIFNFQNLINAYREKTGINLFEKVFDGITLSHIKEYKIKTDIARTDSFMIDSNIRKYGRLQLLIEIIKRLYKILTKNDKKKFADNFSAYINSTSEHYLYDLKSSDLPCELDKIASIYYLLKNDLSPSYKSRKEYKLFLRAFEEHFEIEEEKIKIREQSELSSNILQSPDDEDATFRTKRKASYRGQSANVVETANPDNKVNLIIDLSVSPNNVDDSTVLNERLETIQEKAEDLNEMHQDGGYGSVANDKKMEELGITPVQTAVKGRKSEVAMEIEQKDDEEGYTVHCPNGQAVSSTKARKRLKACFDKKLCSNCPFSDKCPTTECKDSRVYYFSTEDFQKRKRHKSLHTIPLSRRKLRANVEATVHEFTHNMQGHKLKVRGSFKAELYLFSMGIMINFGRIYRYVMKTLKNGELIFNFALKYFNFYQISYHIKHILENVKSNFKTQSNYYYFYSN